MARVPCAPEDRKPTLAYYCEGDGEPVAVEPITVDGVPVVQAPLHFCGTGEAVCEDSSVSSCISDTDGAPTTYGPLPAAPLLADVSGRSPRISRLRLNRDGLAVFPYSVAKRPDQLIDIVDSGGNPVTWDSVTGRFTLPAPPPAAKVYDHVIQSSSNVFPTYFANTRTDGTTKVVTNPSATLSMWVDILCTVQVGYTLDDGGRVFVQPYITVNGATYDAVWGEQQRIANGALSESATITFGTGLDLAPSGSCTIGVAAELQEQTVGLVSAAGPMSLYFKATGMNHD